MRLGEYLTLSWTNILSHKLRSLLSLLGVTFGIAAVIAIITMMQGLERSLVNVITQDLLRADTINVSLEGSFGLFGGDRVFSERDVGHLRNLPGVASADVVGPVRGGALYVGDKRLLEANVVMTTSPDIVPLGVGSYAQEPGEILLGAGIAEKVMKQIGLLETFEDPDEEERLRLTGQLPPVDYEKVLGQQLRMRYLNAERRADEEMLTIVGVVKESQFQNSSDSYVHSDYYHDTEEIAGQEWLVFRGVFVRVNNIDQLLDVRNAVEEYLTSDSSDVKTLVGSQLKLDVSTTKEVVDEIRTNFQSIAYFLGAIGGVSLFVGMIGVMNIMLVTVKERTREIGIMKATGASNSFVMRAFLTECTMICVFGAILGIAFGIGGSLLLSQAIIALSPGLDSVPFVFAWDWYAYAVITGMVVGIASGMYPAWNAAKTDPIRALRYE